LVGQFGSRTEDKRPQIDFDIASKTFDYSAENEFYFYPLETKYPRMICKITDDEKGRYSNGELFKNYFKVKFLNWTEEMANEGPECEISEMMGRLYDKSADIDALLCTIHKTEHSFPKKEID
jgi:exoribonuclease R